LSVTIGSVTIGMAADGKYVWSLHEDTGTPTSRGTRRGRMTASLFAFAVTVIGGIAFFPHGLAVVPVACGLLVTFYFLFGDEVQVRRVAASSTGFEVTRHISTSAWSPDEISTDRLPWSAVKDIIDQCDPEDPPGEYSDAGPGCVVLISFVSGDDIQLPIAGWSDERSRAWTKSCVDGFNRFKPAAA